jgi:hypothetical protein
MEAGIMEVVEAALDAYDSGVPGVIEFLCFVSSALLPLVYFWVTRFRGHERVAMLGTLVAQALVLAMIDPAAKGEWVRFPVFLGMSVSIDAEDAGVVANAGFGAVYLLLLARAAVLGRAGREASGSVGRAGRVAGWMEDRVRLGGRWVPVALLAVVAVPTLWWGWELVRGAPAFVRATLGPQSWLPPFVIPYWDVYRWAILVGGSCAASAAAAIALRARWTTVVLGVLAAAGGATAWLMTHSLGKGFWHMYGHDVYDTCSGKYWTFSLVPTLALLVVGLPLSVLPLLAPLFAKQPRRHGG